MRIKRFQIGRTRGVVSGNAVKQGESCLRNGRVMVNKSIGMMLLFYFLNTGAVFSEAPITEFGEKFTLTFSTNNNMGVFRLQEISRYKTDIPWELGVGFRYRKISARIAVPVSFDKTSFDFQINAYHEKMFVELFLKRYRYFYHEDDIEQNNAGLDIGAGGITAGWIQNNERHSLASVFNLDRKQNISNGSFLYGAGVFYTAIYSENKDIAHYHERQTLFYFGPVAGYSYTWVLPHDMFINTGINIGFNMGINMRENSVLFIPQFRPKLSFGHHNDTWSVNMIVSAHSAILLWERDISDTFVPATVTLNFSKRF
jgi:hypothetical protein